MQIGKFSKTQVLKLMCSSKMLALLLLLLLDLRYFCHHVFREHVSVIVVGVGCIETFDFAFASERVHLLEFAFESGVKRTTFSP